MEENNMNQGYGEGGGQPNDSYQNGGYTNAGQPNDSYQNNNYQNGSYSGNNYQNSGYQNTYQPYNNTQPYQNGQLELEEPVKISEWVLALVMMIPCVNVIMMFVWAFSSTEKKSKSNFFKAYLIFFAISMALVVLIWFAVIFFTAAMLS